MKKILLATFVISSLLTVSISFAYTRVTINSTHKLWDSGAASKFCPTECENHKSSRTCENFVWNKQWSGPDPQARITTSSCGCDKMTYGCSKK